MGKAEEAARKRAERERRLRQLAKDAQTPHRRVELKVNQVREFGDMMGSPQKRIPMKMAGLGITEKVVDVGLIRARAIGMGGRQDYESVYDSAQAIAGHRAWEAHAFRGGKKNFVR